MSAEKVKGPPDSGPRVKRVKDQKQNRLNRTPIASDDVKLSDADLDVLADWVRRLDGLGEEFGEEFGERLIVTSEFDRENEESVRFGGSAESLAAQLPQTWGELLRLGSINQKRADRKSVV